MRTNALRYAAQDEQRQRTGDAPSTEVTSFGSGFVRGCTSTPSGSPVSFCSAPLLATDENVICSDANADADVEASDVPDG